MIREGRPLFSVIIAVYDGESTLQQCLDSVIGQSYRDTE